MVPQNEKSDITARCDIEALVTAFYSKVKADDVIGFIFTEAIPINWEEHIPLITDFWETILLDNMVYTKNAMEVHYAVHKKVPLEQAYFDRWLLLFNATVDELYSGAVADMAKKRAASVAAVMNFKMNGQKDNKSII